MRLTDLLGAPALAVDIAGLAADSREVRAGFLFAALAGSRTDGARFVAHAVSRGAVAVLAAPDANLAAGLAQKGIAFIADENPRLRLAHLAARFHAAQPANVAAVTGTNGKTSVASFARQIWAHQGLSSASLGTLGVVSAAYTAPLQHTSPDPVTLHRELAALARHGVTHLALEASSHGLDQYRLDGVKIAAGAFTNLTRDHLDYHRDEEAYFAAKLRLFRDLLPAGAAAVINADSDRFEAVASIARNRGLKVISYGAQGRDLKIRSLEPHAHGLRMDADILGHARRIDLPLVGAFQSGNALCALGLALATGADEAKAVAALSALQGVPGRMQHAANAGSGAPIFVDYAHTPDALETVLGALRPHADGHLVVVFGCGGDRDRGKRPIMGRIATDLADRVYVTDDNPRTEEASAIRAEILAAAPGAIEVADRAEAIAMAVADLGPSDLLVIAGKGHEQGQNVGGVVRPFDDATVAREAAARFGRRNGTLH